MVMGSLLGSEAYAMEQQDQQQPDPYDPFANTGDIPYAAPVYGPPAPTYGGINPNQGGFRDPVYNPANVAPGPNADIFGGLVAPAFNAVVAPFDNVQYGLPSFSATGGGGLSYQGDQTSLPNAAYQGYNTDVPYYSDFARNTLVPAAESAGQTLGDPFGVGDQAAWLTGSLVPVTAGDIAANAVMAGGPLEAVTGLPIDNLATSLRSGADNLIRGAMPEPSLYPGLSAGVPPINPSGGENVFGFGVHGASPEDAATFAAQHEAALNNPYPWGPATPAEPPPGSSLDPFAPPEKPFWQMSYDELDAAAKAAKASENNIDRQVLGAQYDEYNRAQRIENSMSSSREAQDVARQTIERIEGSLTPEQQNSLFGIGTTGPTAEDLASMRHAVGSLDWDSPEALGRSIARDITNIRPGVDPSTLVGDQLESYAKIRAAMDGATQAGWNLHEVSQSALAHAAGRFSDPLDAEFMLRDFMPGTSAPASATPTPLGLPSPPRFPSSYPSIPEGTMGSEFPDVVAASGGRISPDSPAARMGAPLAYDPQFMTPPPADAAMRDLGLGPVDNTAQQMRDAFESAGPRALGGSPAPTSLTPGEIADAMWEADRRAGINVSPTPPSQALLPERTLTREAGAPIEGPGFTMTENTTPTLTPSERIDQLIRDAQTQPVVGDVHSLSNDEIIQQANRLGVPIDEGAITRGTPAAREPEIAKVQAAADAELGSRTANSMTKAEDNVFDHFWDLQGQQRAQDTADKVQRWSDQFKGDVPGKTAGIGRQLMEVLYAPFGGDLSFGRQDAMRLLNPLRAGETVQVLRDTGKAIASRDEALRMAADFPSRAEALGVKMHFSDWAGGSLVNREGMYSTLLNKLPGYEALNRGFATEINSRRINAIEGYAASHPKASIAELQTEANRLERTTGRGSLGSGDIEKALSSAGPLFTSMRFAASIPERTASLIPWTRLTDGSVQMFGPVWREAVKDHAGFIGTVLTAMAAAQQAGLNVGWDPKNQTSGSNGKVPFGAIQLPNGSFVDLTGGSKKYVNAVIQLATGEKNGKDYPWLLDRAENGQFKGTVAEFVRNLTGPVVQLSAAAAKEGGVKGAGIEFLRPDYWDKGVTGTGSFADRAAQFVVPLWIQDVASAVKASAEGQKLSAGAAVAPLSFFGAGVQTYDNTVNSSALSQMRADALGGAKYSDLMPHEQQALNDALSKKDPEAYAKALKESQANQDPAIRAYQQARDAAQADKNAKVEAIFRGVQNGTYDPMAARTAIKALNETTSQTTAALLKNPDYQKAVGEFENNDSVARRALDLYYAIPSTAKGPDGKVDWNRVDQTRAELFGSIGQTDPALAARLQREVDAPNLNDHPLLKMYKEEQPMINSFFDLPKAEQGPYRIANPFDDAKLVFLGYEPYVLSPKASEYLKGLAPGQPARVGAR